MATALVDLPTFQDGVNQNFQVEILGGPQDVFSYLNNFPEEVYTKSPDTRLYKFMRVMLGDSGVNLIRKQYLQARLDIEELGLDVFDLDAFFGDPLGFGRIFNEAVAPITGPLIRQADNQVRSQNASYRNRAINYISGARAGNTPEGMRLIAKAGVGHDVEIVENYRWLYDQHTDDYLGIPYLGRTLSTEEFIVLPSREVSTTVVQEITIGGNPNQANSGNFQLKVNGLTNGNYTYTTQVVTFAGYDGSGHPTYTYTPNTVTTNLLPWNATRTQIRLALETILGVGNVQVNGGPGPNIPWQVRFGGNLDQTNVPPIIIVNDSLSYSGGGSTIFINVSQLEGGPEVNEEIATFSASDRHNLISALDHIKPVTSIVTVQDGQGKRSRTNFSSITASSEYTESIRFVTGTTAVAWPTGSDKYWIKAQVENQAPRISKDLQYHYQGFHNIKTISATSSRMGSDVDPLEIFEAARAVAAYAEPLFVTSADLGGSYINGIYPIEYQGLPGTPAVGYMDQFWESATNNGTIEDLIVNLGSAQAINYVSLDIGRAPIQINVAYDTMDDPNFSNFVPVTPVAPYSNVIAPSTDQAHNAWTPIGLEFTNAKKQLIFASKLRISFTRLNNYQGSVQVRNLRIGRNVS